MEGIDMYEDEPDDTVIDASHFELLSKSEMAAAMQRWAFRFLSSTRPTVSQLHRNLLDELREGNAARSRAGFAELPLPSYGTFYRMIRSLPPEISDYHRNLGANLRGGIALPSDPTFKKDATPS